MKTRFTHLITTVTILAIFSISGCSTTGNTLPNNTDDIVQTTTQLGMNVLKVAIDNKCRSELEQQNAWRIAKIAMSSEQAEAVQSKVCGCVSEQAPQHLSIVDMTNAAIDPQYRTQVVTKVVSQSLQSCYSRSIQ